MNRTLDGARILITGGAGFIGSYIADQTIAAGAAKVVVIDNFIRGRAENLTSALESGRLELIEADICDAAVVDRAMRGIDFVFHQAALRITHCAEAPQRALAVMATGFQHVLDAAVRHGVQKVLAASSASVYGEPVYLPMDEEHPFKNRTLYGGLKIANEQMLRAYSDMYGLRYVALRPFNVYGPRMDVFGVYTEVLIRWLERLATGEAPVMHGDGLQTMDFVYVEDVARAYLLAATADISDVALNVGTGVETSLRDLCLLTCAAAGHPAVRPVFEPARKVNPVTRRQASVDRARALIGFAAGTDLATGLEQLVAWYRTLTDAKGAPIGGIR
jgi:UDP-glucose 4-epimerase